MFGCDLLAAGAGVMDARRRDLELCDGQHENTACRRQMYRERLLRKPRAVLARKWDRHACVPGLDGKAGAVRDDDVRKREKRLPTPPGREI